MKPVLRIFSGFDTIQFFALERRWCGFLWIRVFSPEDTFSDLNSALKAAEEKFGKDIIWKASVKE